MARWRRDGGGGLGLLIALTLPTAVAGVVIEGNEPHVEAYYRTATDRSDDGLVEGLRWALNGDSRHHPSVTQTVLKTLDREPNLRHVLSWKRPWSAGDESTTPAAA